MAVDAGERVDMFKYETMYNLDNVALDEPTESELQAISNCLKVLVFPTRVRFLIQ